MITAACVLQFSITLYQTTRCGTKDDPIDMRRHNLARQNIGLYHVQCHNAGGRNVSE
jgi:hypothetical protein